MSTAEQIIAEVVREHAPKVNDDPWTQCSSSECEDWPGGNDEVFAAHVAAHVVAALTNAGKVVVDQSESCIDYGVKRDVISGGRAVAVARNRHEAEGLAQNWGGGPEVVQRRVFYGEWELAAARVAEGGEHGEV